MTGSEKVSIILTTYNCVTTLPDILAAIEQQNYSEIEVIIKDGISQDGTLEYIKQYQQNSKYTVRWKSQKDTGIYDAMNQGYRISTGDIIVFCSDKLIGNDAVSCMVKAIYEGGESCIGAHADLIYATEKKVMRYWKMGEGKIRDGWMPGHPTLYLKREIYEKYGLYKTDYRIAADYEFMVRICKDEKNKLAYVPRTLVNMYYGGTSTSGIDSYIVSLKEAYRALRENNIKFPWRVNILRIIKLYRQFIRAKGLKSV